MRSYVPSCHVEGVSEGEYRAPRTDTVLHTPVQLGFRDEPISGKGLGGEFSPCKPSHLFATRHSVQREGKTKKK